MAGRFDGDTSNPPLSWAWLEDHYEYRPLPPTLDSRLHCRRCGIEVNYVTKHAVERHGDTDIQVYPTVTDKTEGGWKW